MTASIPTSPAVPVLTFERPLDTIPAEARMLYLRRTCNLAEAGRFLGLGEKNGGAGNAAHKRAQKYWERVVEGPDAVKYRHLYEPDELLPRADEIPVVGRAANNAYIVDTHALVWLRHPQVSPW